MIKPPNDRIDCSAQAQNINEWVKAGGRAERVHIDFLRKSARFVPNADSPGEVSNLLEGLREHKPNYGAWSTSYKHQKRPWSQNYPPYNEEGKGRQKRSRRTAAQEHRRENKSPQGEASAKVPEPSGPPPPPKARPSQKQDLPAGSAPPGFSQLTCKLCDRRRS